MRIKVYFGTHAVIFSDTIPDGAEGEFWGVMPGDEISLAKLSQKLQFTKRLFIISPDIGRIFDDFTASERVIVAGGGVALNDRGEILMILRNGHWDLPKGKIEPDECIEECAVREVEEETGLHGIEPGDFLTHTYHTYQIDGRWVLKRTAWFRMRYRGDEEPVPQTVEGITFAGWIAPEGLRERMAHSYRTIADVLQAAGYEL